MSTDTISEDRVVAAIGFVHARRVTSTSSGAEDPLSGLLTTLRHFGASDFWDVISRTVISHGARSNDLESALIDFTKAVGGVPEVVAVTHAKDGHVNLVWAFIRRRDKAVRKEIYARERALMAKHPDLVFDFNVVAFDQGATGALVPDDLQGRVILYRPQE